jgi:hypothetical protein
MKYYVTFGSGHHDTHGRSLMHHYVVIEAEHEIEARQTMFSYFGPKWASIYTEAGFAGQVERFGLTELWIGGVELCCGMEQIKFLAMQDHIDQLTGEGIRTQTLFDRDELGTIKAALEQYEPQSQQAREWYDRAVMKVDIAKEIRK